MGGHSGAVGRAVIYNLQGWWFDSQFPQFLARCRGVPRKTLKPIPLASKMPLPAHACFPKGIIKVSIIIIIIIIKETNKS